VNQNFTKKDIMNRKREKHQIYNYIKNGPAVPIFFALCVLDFLFDY
jgi:hypothetical protein